MIIFEELRVKTSKREVLLDITGDVKRVVKNSGIKEGVCRVFVPHTTAAITINENADPAVMKDIVMYLKKLIPQDSGFFHMEGNSDAHIKTTLTGPSLDVLIHDGKLMLGTWQGIMLAEYDGPRNRSVYVQVEGN